MSLLHKVVRPSSSFWSPLIGLSRNARFLSTKLSGAGDLDARFRSRLEVHQEVISADEEQLLATFLQPLLAKRRYEGSHWDSVITRYKEIDLAHYLLRPDSSQSAAELPQKVRDVNRVLEKIEAFVRQRCEYDEMKFLSTHCIDLASDGHIGGHIDSVKFSGDLISGLSLLSSRTMHLVRDVQRDNLQFSPSLQEKKLLEQFLAETESGGHVCEGIEMLLPASIQIVLPPRSMYVMKGLTRYHYSHAVLGQKSEPADPNVVDFRRRISLIFRN